MCASNMPDGLDATFREFKAFMGEYSWAKRVNNFKAFGFQKSKRHDHAVGLELRTVPRVVVPASILARIPPALITAQSAVVD